MGNINTNLSINRIKVISMNEQIPNLIIRDNLAGLSSLLIKVSVVFHVGVWLLIPFLGIDITENPPQLIIKLFIISSLILLSSLIPVIISMKYYGGFPPGSIDQIPDMIIHRSKDGFLAMPKDMAPDILPESYVTTIPGKVGTTEIDQDDWYDPPDPEMEYYKNYEVHSGECQIDGRKVDCKHCFPEDRAKCEQSMREGS